MSILRRFIKNNRGDGFLVAMILLVTFYLLFIGMNLDGNDSNYASHLTKQALNRAVKAAVNPPNKEKLAEGVLEIDEDLSYDYFWDYLRANLYINADGSLSDKCPLSEEPDVPILFLYNGEYGYPYVFSDSYEDPETGQVISVEHEFKDPGVAALAKAKRKQVFDGREVTFYVFSAAEILD